MGINNMKILLTLIDYESDKILEIEPRFEYIQATYDLIRGCTVLDEDSFDVAYYDCKDNRWIYNDEKFTDFTVCASEQLCKKGEIKPMINVNMTRDDLIHDILVLVGRLYGEDPVTFAQETEEVMGRWKPLFEEKMRG